ncbi:restriction endonuclease subunit S [Halomonas sp. JS92-SW72]|uniref:restriction endonuclease subunit S n=1 Tax=Halomonas sp. JS92-SW72 TaxID=2306583 RepID=UPI000E5B6D55|nr:restriction endonuclease subunit S [Halomonas sp. JS92-SW72]AXY41791.1 restriction endonuclease subunit S [Halomonas sp. JS92-SW72]
MSARELITDHLDLWTGAVTQKRSGGRGNNGKIELTGIKKLRELILELAVRGKLVEQDPSDEPASVLLERIAEEKARLVKEGKIKKPRQLPKLAGMEKPFDLPNGWSWGQLEDVGHDWGQKQPDQQLTYIDVSAIDNIKGEIRRPEVISADDAPSRARKKVMPGTLIYSTVRPYLQNIAVLEDQFDPEPIASTAFAVINPLGGIPARFLLHYLRSPAFVRYVESVQSGIAYPAINDKQFFSGLVPIPPALEQHRIVEKVDELMALCDRLEQQVGDQLEAHEVLVDTLLDALTRSADAAEVTASWARIAEHFDTLFTTEASIDKLKQTILQLAVMGRLVEQDPNDEPASVLLQRIAEEKARLVKEGKIKKPKKLLEVAEEEKSFEAPHNWAFTRMTELYDLQNGYAFKSGWFSHSGIKLLRNINISHGVIDWSECALLPESMASEYQRFSLRSGDLVISLDRPLISTGLKYSVVKEKDLPCLLLQRVARFQPYSDTVITRYLEYWLNSAMFTSSIDPGRSNGVPHISTGQIGKVVFPLPPKDEQHRIVDKVDELMALCDQLKARLGEAGATRTHLAEAVVEQAVN